MSRCLDQIDRTRLAEGLWQMVNTPSPTGQERAMAVLFADLLREAGADVSLDETLPSSPNVIARVSGKTPGATFQLAGHLDHVNVPHSPPTRKQDRISGRGAVVCNTRSEDLSSLLDRTVGPGGVDVAVEATGATASPNLAIRALRPRGRLVLFSYVWNPEPMDMGLIHMRELHVVGSCRSLDAVPVCLEMMGDGRLAPGELVDVRVPIGEFKEAFEALTKGRAEVFKAVLLPGGAAPQS